MAKAKSEAKRRITNFGYKIEKTLLDRIRAEAQKDDRSVSKMSSMLIREALDARERQSRELKQAAS